MLKELEELRLNALLELEGINNTKELESWRVRYLGRKSHLTEVLRSLATLPLEERKAVGAFANRVKTYLENSLEQKGRIVAEELAKQARPGITTFDITLPGRSFPTGRLHPITQTLYEICDIFVSMGFQVVEGPEVEWDYYNFAALNMPEEHPAQLPVSGAS